MTTTTLFLQQANTPSRTITCTLSRVPSTSLHSLSELRTLFSSLIPQLIEPFLTSSSSRSWWTISYPRLLLLLFVVSSSLILFLLGRILFSWTLDEQSTTPDNLFFSFFLFLTLIGFGCSFLLCLACTFFRVAPRREHLDYTTKFKHLNKQNLPSALNRKAGGSSEPRTKEWSSRNTFEPFALCFITMLLSYAPGSCPLSIIRFSPLLISS